jgi:AraC family transcriptional regulator
VLRISAPISATSSSCYDSISSQQLRSGVLPALPTISRSSRFGPHYRKFDRDSADRSAAGPSASAGGLIVHISPLDLVKRQSVTWRGMQAELLQSTRPGKIEYRFRAPRHLLVAYEQGSRHEGETFVEGLPRSARRDLARKLTLVPAGHEYHEWHEPRAPVRLMFFHFDPSELQLHPALGISDISLTPRLFFEDPTLWATVFKLKRLLESPISENRPYLEALGLVLVHELARLDRGADRIDPQVRGGLAAWQQRSVTAYIEEHLPEQIPLATLAQLARLSPYHFCRAFKQSFGLPPHRYHTKLRIERAKVLLENRPLSVTQIGMTLGFSETSSFTAAFRRATGLTPSAYHRSVA